MSHNYTVDPAPLNITAYTRFLITRFIFFKEKNYFITAGKKIQICPFRNRTENYLRLHDQQTGFLFLYIYTMYNTQLT